MAHGIYVSESTTYTTDSTKIRSAKNYTDALDNCVPVTLSGLVAGQRDLWIAVQATESTKKDDIWVTTTPELIYDDAGKTIADYYNGINDGANEEMRVCKHEKGDIFATNGVTITGTPDETNCYLHPKADGWTVDSTETDAYAEFLDVRVKDGITLYGFEVL